MSGLKICCTGILFIMLKLVAMAQVTAQSPAVKNDFKLIFEKVYLHTDREYYVAGDDIWFKAYLLNAQTNQLFSSSNNLYVELIDPRSAVIDRKLIRLDKGLGNGDFKLGDSIAAGTYRIRAYTNWMLNYGDNFIFEKEIHLYNDVKSIAKPVATTPPGEKTNNKANAAPPAVPAQLAVTNTPRLRFFPEGGSMIEQAPGIVAFKAEDATGKGLFAKGSIYSSAGDKIIDFESDPDGMGSFVLLPQPGLKYEARGTYNNKIPFNIQLPTALLKGFSFTVHYADTTVKVIINTNMLTLKELGDKKLNLLGKSKGVPVFATTISINNEQTAVNISKALLPQGITVITLLDSGNKPQCERLLYNEKPEKGIIVLKTDKISYEPKSKVTLNIGTLNQDSVPVKANLSLAVVDAGLIPANDGDILSYVYLQSEIRGKIQNPSQYFDEHNLQRKKQLDLLLLTQGWRDFVWKRLADSAIRISYAMEQGIPLSGRVRQIWANKPIPNMNITLFANGAVGTKLFSARTDTNGHYSFDGLNFYGNQQISITSANDKGSQKGYIIPDTTSKPIYPVRPVRVIADSPLASVSVTNNLLKRKVMSKKTTLADTTHLKTVTITGVHGQFTRIDTVVKMARKDYELKTLYDYLLEKIPGTNSRYPRQVYFLGINANLGFGPIAPVFTSNNLPKNPLLKRYVRFYDIPLDQIVEIHYRKIYIVGKPTIIQQGQGFRSGDNFWLDMKVKPHAFDDVDFHIAHFDIDGYNEARTFYTPDYSKPVSGSDYRTTIHWAPNVNTSSVNTEISYYNADPKTKVRIIAEGITDKGVPIFGTTTYEIK